MPTVIDSLLVELGLDVSGFNKGQKEAVDTINKFEQQYTKTTKETEENGKKMAQAIYKVRNQVLSLMAAFTAGAGMKLFFQEMTATDAAAGRLAKNIGISVNELTAWQGVAARSGGTAQGIAGTMQGLTNQFQQLALTGQSEVIPYFRAIGVAIADINTGKMRPLNDILLDLSDKFSKMDPAKAQAFGRGLGIDEGTVNVLMKGREAIKALLIEQEKLGHANKADTDAAIKRAAALEKLKQVSEDLGRKFLTALTPAIEAVTNALVKVGIWFQEHPEAAKIAIGTITVAVGLLSVALSVTAVAAFASFGAAGVAAFTAIDAAAAPVLAAMALFGFAGFKLSQVKEHLDNRPNDGSFSSYFRPDRAGPNAPRGIRNNNPGNLNFVGQEGATKEQGANGRFAVFKTMAEGIAALAAQLKRYASRGDDTITEIVGKYAPKNENNTQAYIQALSKKLGVDPNAQLNVNDKETLRKLIEGISTIENGKGRINLEQIDAALSARNRSASISNNAHSEVHIGQVSIQTQATDARGIAGALGREVDRYHNMAAMANYGLA